MGAPKGHSRWGGRVKGQPNKATVRNRLIAAQIAERTIADARTQGKKLAKEVLEEFMELFADLARDYYEQQNLQEFEHWGLHAVATATQAAKYQSPQFSAVAVMAQDQQPRRNTDGRDRLKALIEATILAAPVIDRSATESKGNGQDDDAPTLMADDV